MAVNKNFVVKNGIEVNNNLIFADATTNRVGIASTTPNYTLNVAGGIGATDLYISGVSTFIGIGTFSSDVYVDGNLNVVGDITYDEVTGRNLNITGLSTFEGNSYFGSNVGIGTTNPDSALHIQSPSASTTLTLTAPSLQPNKIQFQTYAGTLDAEIKNESSGLIFSTGVAATTRYNIDSAGKHTFGSGSTNVQIGNAGDAWVENALYVGDSASPKISLYAAGNATFNGDVTATDGHFNATNVSSSAKTFISASGGIENATITAGGSATFAGIAVTSGPLAVKGQNGTHEANSIRIGEEGSGAAQIRFYGPDASTNGSLTFRSSRSDGSNSIDIVFSDIGEIKVGSAFSVGQAGVVTATSYYGDGSTLTNAGTSLGMVIALSG